MPQQNTYALTDAPERLKPYLSDYLRQRGLPLKRPFRCLSPAHEDRHPSMSYNSRAENVHCFSCGATYDIFDLIGMDYGLDSFTEQLEKARELFGEGFAALPVRGEVIELPETGKDAELDGLRRRSNGDISYFLSRGITAGSCDKYGLFQLDWRAYFPIMADGTCTGWCARAVDESVQPRYKNSPGPMGLWNADVLDADSGTVFITEGIIDAICLEQSGQKAIALCGSQNADKLLRLIERDRALAGRWKFILCGDPDPAGERMNAALSEGLGRLGYYYFAMPLEIGDIGQIYIDDREKLRQKISEAERELLSGAVNGPGDGLRDCVPCGGTGAEPLLSAADSLGAFFEAAGRRASRGAYSTGFPSLDKLLDGGLHPGLYVIGAVSSVGKTSFALQMADYIAEHSCDVLFFSLEQSRFELMAKSLSRTSASIEGGQHRRALTSRQLLSGNLPEDLYGRQLLEDTKEVYAKASSRLFIREGMGDVGAAEIRRAVGEYRERSGEAPVVIVDYLQILRPSDPRATDKQNTDRAVMELKLLSRDFDIPVIAISSFNRENYRAAVSMEAFKESGAVEYSSDVLLGLQLAGTGERDFDINKAKSREPRKLELIMLKNRNGIPWAKVGLEYRARFGLFGEG